MDNEDLYLPDLLERIEQLEDQLLRLQHIIQFHGLNKIDKKYCKAFPKKGEYPFFTSEGHKTAHMKPKPLSLLRPEEAFYTLWENPKKKDIKKSKKLMKECLKMAEEAKKKKKT